LQFHPFYDKTNQLFFTRGGMKNLPLKFILLSVIFAPAVFELVSCEMFYPPVFYDLIMKKNLPAVLQVEAPEVPRYTPRLSSTVVLVTGPV
jgi:hypothetical protein